MHLDDYQEAALRTASDDADRDVEILLKGTSWAGEAGEFCEMLAQRIDAGDDADKALLIRAALLAGTVGEFFNKLKKRIGHGHDIDDAELAQTLRAGIREAEAFIAHMDGNARINRRGSADRETPMDADLKDELGDGLWYLAVLAALHGWSLSEIAEGNIEKLYKRYPDGFSQERSINRTV